MCECCRCAIKAARIFYSARQKNQATPRLLLSWLSQYPLNPASVILPSLSLTPSVPLTFPSHSSHLLSYFSFLSVMGFGAVEDWGEMLCVCVCLWWVVRAVHRRSGQAESNCRCCGAKVIRRATRSRWGKIEQASPPSGVLPLRAAVSLPCLPATQLSSAPGELYGTTQPSSGGREGATGKAWWSNTTEGDRWQNLAVC